MYPPSQLPIISVIELKNSTVPATVKSANGKYTFKVTAIANKAFKGDKKLKKVVIGKNVQTIGRKTESGYHQIHFSEESRQKCIQGYPCESKDQSTG